MHTSKAATIGGDASILLDVMRIAAAATVVITHANDQWATSAAGQLNKVAHAAVVVFFVLSGYVIAFTTTSHNRGAKQYAVARLSRLYSVVLPALVLTGIIEFVVRNTAPSLAAAYSRDYSWLRYVMSTFFLSESALFSASPPMNNPLWSLNFEFWYYVLFGLWLYRHYLPKPWLVIGFACCLAGPKILLLMPIWLFGVFAYRLPKPPVSAGFSWLVIFLLLLLAGLSVAYCPFLPFTPGLKPFFFANQFVTDWLTGVALSLALWFLPTTSYLATFSLRQHLRTIADLSFPLYVLHYPLLIMWRAVFGWQPADMLGMWLAIGGVGLAALAIGVFMERGRGAWIQLFRWVLTTPNLTFLLKAKSV